MPGEAYLTQSDIVDRKTLNTYQQAAALLGTLGTSLSVEWHALSSSQQGEQLTNDDQIGVSIYGHFKSINGMNDEFWPAVDAITAEQKAEALRAKEAEAAAHADVPVKVDHLTHAA